MKMKRKLKAKRSSQVKHPPMPRSPHFFTVEPGATWIFHCEPRDNNSARYWTMKEAAKSDMLRTVVSAVARCAWEDQWDKLSANDGYDTKTGFSLMDMAVKNSLAWKRWAKK